MSAEMPKMPEPDHNKALAVAILKTPAVDKFVSIEGEPRTVPMFHLSTLLQYGEQVYQEATRQAMEQLETKLVMLWRTGCPNPTADYYEEGVNDCLDALRSLLPNEEKRHG